MSGQHLITVLGTLLTLLMMFLVREIYVLKEDIGIIKSEHAVLLGWKDSYHGGPWDSGQAVERWMKWHDQKHGVKMYPGSLTQEIVQ